jgi:two-component system OmpR family sensor kinase
MTLRLRMTLYYTALLAIVIVAVGAFLVLRLRVDLIASVDKGLGPAARQIAHDYSQEGVPEFHDSSGTVLKGDRAAAQLLSADGRVVASFGEAPITRPLLTRAQLARGTATATSGDFRVAAAPVRYRGARQVVAAAQSLAAERSSVSHVLALLALAVPAALLAAALGGWWLAGRSLRPIARITSTAEAIGPEQLSDRVRDPRSADEVGRLARTFNTMLDRIERAVAEQRRLIADASHELRTPLAAVRAEIDVSLRMDELAPEARMVLASAREEIDRMSRTVADLLTLAEGDEGAYRLRLAPAELGEVTAEVVATLGPFARECDVRLEHDGPSAQVVADHEELGRAVRNLVENAIRFTPPGGTVTVRSGRSSVAVHDDGPGIPAEVCDRVFDRFYRLDPARGRTTGGSGLGLAIVKQIAEAHGGSVRVLPRAPCGCSFVIELDGATEEALLSERS